MGGKKGVYDKLIIDIDDISSEKEEKKREADENEIGGAAFFEKNRVRARKEKPSRDARKAEFDIIRRWEDPNENKDDLLDEMFNLMQVDQKLEEIEKLEEVEKVTEEHEWEAEYIRQRMDKELNMETAKGVLELLIPLSNYINSSKEAQQSARAAGKAGVLPKRIDNALKKHAQVLNFNENKRLVYRWFYYKNGEHIPYADKAQQAIVEGDYVTTRQFISTSSHKRFIHGEENGKRIVEDEKGQRTFVKVAIITRYGVPIGNAVYKPGAGPYVETQLHGSTNAQKNGGRTLAKFERQLKFEQDELKAVEERLKTKEDELARRMAFNITQKNGFKKQWTWLLSKEVDKLKDQQVRLKEKAAEAEKTYLTHRGNMVGQAEVLMNRWAVLAVKKVRPVKVMEDNVEYTDYEVILEETDIVPTDKTIKEVFTGKDSTPQRRQSLDFDAIAKEDIEKLDDIYRIPVDEPVSLSSIPGDQLDELKKLLDANQIVITATGFKEVRTALDEGDKRILNKYTISRNASALVIVRDPEVRSEAGDEFSEEDDNWEEERVEEKEEGSEARQERKPGRFNVSGFMGRMFNWKSKKKKY